MAEAREMFKPKDVEELIDWYFHRPLAARLVNLVAPTPVMPNHLTFTALAVGASCGFAFYAGGQNSAWIVVGALLLFASIILDCADGQLARVRGTSSMLGRALDGGSDYFPTTSAFYGLAFLLQQRVPELGWWVWILGYSAGASMVWHCFLYDGVKNIYLRNTKPPTGGLALGWLDLKALEDEWNDYRRQGRWFIWAILWLFVANTRQQHKVIAKEQPRDRATTETTEEREIYRTGFLRSMRLWSYLGLGTHLFLLVAGALLSVVDPAAIVIVWLIMLVPMNILTVWLLATDPGRFRQVQSLVLQRRAVEAAQGR